ncbi:MAG: hypothetical protein UR73_C0007G0019 [candidate division WS6 bacterium GW2011_GWF1_35_23]|uniref:Glycosyl transferase family 11 n=1 Tax=candidate division WS6 bacterium GW2011_GWF1_35_23 TaxID=1619097 RepID=A0A0G0C852_9BACT|nr:MAG: hypothetical protein UR73_C0007G0019 [candidate division WS6 bacterium GW2011_GWF1_35_23]
MFLRGENLRKRYLKYRNGLMVIVEIKGGLGNQLFQYAFGRAISLYRKEQLVLDVSWYYKDNVIFILKSIRGRIITFLKNRSIVFDVPTPRRFCLNDFFLNKDVKKKIFFSSPKTRTFQSTKKSFDKELYNAILMAKEKDIYLRGYWQSYKYFEKFTEQMKDELKSKGSEKISEKRGLITNKVGIHFRRGDYVNYKGAQDLFETLSMEYYFNAIDVIKKKINDPEFMIFSDDIDWVKKNFQVMEDIEYVEPNGEVEDFTKMSDCDHFIIANSTYSWWAAFLSRNSNKLIIAPEKWYKDVNENKFSKDIIPNSWIKI